jgi:nitroreductase
MNVTEALRARTSIRAFKPDPVPETLVRELLTLASYAPSGGNLQPWKVIAVAGAERDAVCALAKQALMAGAAEESEYPPYPPHLWEPYRTRRFKNGEEMYALVGIPREERARRLMHFARNYDFFDAPVGLFFVIDRRMGHAQWSHLGMFMQSLALAATERGLGTCMQEAWARVRETLARHFALPAEEMIVCGMALGYADMSHPVNALRPERAPVEEFAQCKGFDGAGDA